MTHLPSWFQTFGNTADCVFVVDSGQRIVFWNQGAERLLGYSSADIEGRHCYEIIGGRRRSGRLRCRANCEVQRSIQRGIPIQNADFRTRTREGKEIWVNASIVAVLWGREAFALHLLHDVSRQEETTEAMDQVLSTLKSYDLWNSRRNNKWPGTEDNRLATKTPRLLSLLTRREVEVLSLLAAGHSNEMLAERLKISPHTVRNHIRNILRKTDLHSKAQAVGLALRNGLA